MVPCVWFFLFLLHMLQTTQSNAWLRAQSTAPVPNASAPQISLPVPTHLPPDHPYGRTMFCRLLGSVPRPWLSFIRTAGSMRCREVSASQPFWKDLPYANIHSAITPNVLHQLYQGVFKHLVNWCTRIVGAAELDRRIRCLPPRLWSASLQERHLRTLSDLRVRKKAHGAYPSWLSCWNPTPAGHPGLPHSPGLHLPRTVPYA